MAGSNNASPRVPDFARKYEDAKESYFLQLSLKDAWLFKALCDTWKASKSEAFRRAIRMAVADAGIDVPPLELGGGFTRERIAVRAKGSSRVFDERNPCEIVAAAIVDAEGEVLWDRTYGHGRRFSDDAAEFGKVFRSAGEVCVWNDNTLSLLRSEGIEPVMGQWVFDDSDECAKRVDYGMPYSLGFVADEMGFDMDETGARGLVRDCLGILGIRRILLNEVGSAPQGRLTFL